MSVPLHHGIECIFKFPAVNWLQSSVQTGYDD